VSDPAGGRFSRCTEFGRFDVTRDDTTLRFDHTIVQPRDGVERGENRALLPHRDIGCVLAGEHDSPIDLAQVVALKARLPDMYGFREEVVAGGLLSYGASFPDLFRRAAELVDKILRGAKAADIPVEQPTKFDLVINLKTAKALGLTVPHNYSCLPTR